MASAAVIVVGGWLHFTAELLILGVSVCWAFPFLYPPLRSAGRHYGRKRSLRTGLCPQCGYDLRATIHRCPECGRAVPPKF